MRCQNCTEVYEDRLNCCPYCGYIEGEGPDQEYGFALWPGTVLKERYVVGMVLGAGGFGIIYKAWDNTFERTIAIKEFFPNQFVTRKPNTKEVILCKHSLEQKFQKNKERFMDEARNLAKFQNDLNILNIYEFFEENNTAYYIMEYLDGENLDVYAGSHNITAEKAVEIVSKVAEAAGQLHKLGIIHRDISPDNIYMCQNDIVKLIDFGSARFALDEDRKMTVVIKPGFAPPEQYDSVNRQGPWTDIYALGATLYFLLTKERPEESTDRKMNDRLIPPHECEESIPENLSNAVMKAMAVNPCMRFQNVNDFLMGIQNKKKIPGIAEEEKKRKVKRKIGVSAAFSAIALGGSVFAYYYFQQKNQNSLPDAAIEMWICSGADEQNQNKSDAFQKVIEEFHEAYPNVTVELKSFPEENYKEKLMEAKENGTMPQLFESTDIDEGILSDAETLDSVLTEDIVNASVLLDEFNTRFPEGKRMPLGFALPVIYVNKELQKDYSQRVSSLSELNMDHSNEGEIGFSINEDSIPSYQEIWGNMEDFSSMGSSEDFYNKNSIYYLTDTSDLSDVQSMLSGRYEMIYIDEAEIPVRFGYFFSIEKGNRTQKKVSERLLQFLLQDNAQDYLHMQNNSSLLPFSQKKLEDLKNIYRDYQELLGEYEKKI